MLQEMVKVHGRLVAIRDEALEEMEREDPSATDVKQRRMVTLMLLRATSHQTMALSDMPDEAWRRAKSLGHLTLDAQSVLEALDGTPAILGSVA